MKDIIDWLCDAVADKNINLAMTHYHVSNGRISGTDGRVSAGRPWPYGGEFLVPGNELERVVARMPANPTVEEKDGYITIRAGRFHGTIQTMDVSMGMDLTIPDDKWEPIPEGLLPLLMDLRPFVSDNASQPWALCVALQRGWLYATTNVVLAGAKLPSIGDIDALLPSYALDFVLRRMKGLVEWAWTDNYVAFRWEDGSWMRSQLVLGGFPEAAAKLVRAAWDETEFFDITPEFRTAFGRIAGMAESAVRVEDGTISCKYKNAEAVEEVETPWGASRSIWSPTYIADVVRFAVQWEPTRYPQPVPFRTKTLAGYALGRNE